MEAEKEAAKEAGEEEEGPLEVEGFLFKRLIERRPDHRQELLSFRDHLLASSSDNEALKVRAFNSLNMRHQGTSVMQGCVLGRRCRT